MKTSNRGLDLIKEFEGFSAKPYRCSAGYWTIGYGSRVDFLPAEFKAIGVITKAQAERLLQMHLEDIEDQVEEYVNTPLTQNQFDAIISFVYNLGIGAFKKSTLLRLINRGQYDAASYEFLKWNKERKGSMLVVSAGLSRRRRAEHNLFREE